MSLTNQTTSDALSLEELSVERLLEQYLALLDRYVSSQEVVSSKFATVSSASHLISSRPLSISSAPQLRRVICLRSG